MSEDWEVVEVVGTEEEADLIVGFLRNIDIPSEVDSLFSHEFPVHLSRLGEVRIRVPREHLLAARSALAEQRGRFVAAADEPGSDEAAEAAGDDALDGSGDDRGEGP